MTLVKICGITNLEDARAAIDAGADALGFNFYRGSRRYIAPVDARRIIEELPTRVLCVGVFVNEGEPQSVARLAAVAGVAAVQLHGDETPEYCRRLGGLTVIKALRVAKDFDPASAAGYATHAILLDAYAGHERGGTGLRFDWSVARLARAHTVRLYLAGGLTPETVAEAITVVEPFAVDVCSGVERAPGKKDAGRMRAFIEAARGR